MFIFDDESVLAPDEGLRRAMDMAFHDFDPLRLDTFLVSCVEFFWAEKRQPTKHGDEIEWNREYSQKADLAERILEEFLSSQRSTEFLGIDKFNLILASPEGGEPVTLSGQAALHAANNNTVAQLLYYGGRGLIKRSFDLMEDERFEEAVADLELVVQLAPGLGEAWSVLGVALQKMGDGERAAPIHKKAAEMIKSKYLGKAQCLKCGWVPDGSELWACDECDVEFDTFETKAHCPKCQKTWKDTKCIACSEWSPHEQWWISS